MPTDRALYSTNWRVKDPAPLSPPASHGNVKPQPSTAPSDLLWGNPLERDRRLRREYKAKNEATRPVAQGTRIYVGNMPYVAKKSDVQSLFEDAGYTVENIDISMDPFTHRNPSYCFVDFDTEEAATSAMETLNGRQFLGRPLKLKPCIQKRSDPSKLESEGLMFSRWLDDSPSGNQAKSGANDTFSTSDLQTVKENRTLWVGGLPKPLDQHTSDTAIRNLFADFKVEAVSMVKSPHDSMKLQRIPGNHFYAFVDFDSREEAEAAAKAMNGRLAYGGRLRVRKARIPSMRAVDGRGSGGGEENEREAGEVLKSVETT
ncbi:RNA-binding domain-containing protein [Lindgomyces ingoldianus]|uniref:RNA-binding domain-containing protein n=1 Tax=Lindgomyces ingoldianus TaxID=673940 RepID=A0ACB6R5F3_9PLEO|nr:RNA-binding domain-containing protein [Lindgomyces ingoldianus]KAF2474386.1 RNA-binding domain-containing protein [Lindgomyces ingoldianus]